jgi:RNA polymerase sigma-70 factor (ECF subfamily)
LSALNVHIRITEEEERNLLSNVAEGDWQAFTRLYDAYSPLIIHYLQVYLTDKHDVEEIGQEVFLKVWKKREILVTVRSFKNYVFIMARNALNDFLKARQALLQKQAGYSKDYVLPHYSADDKLITDQYESIARSGLDMLSEKQRRIFLLRTRDEMTIQEIADAEGMSVGGVHKSLQQSTQQLKDYLARNGISFTLLLLILFFQP